MKRLCAIFLAGLLAGCGGGSSDSTPTNNGGDTGSGSGGSGGSEQTTPAPQVALTNKKEAVVSGGRRMIAEIRVVEGEPSAYEVTTSLGEVEVEDKAIFLDLQHFGSELEATITVTAIDDEGRSSEPVKGNVDVIESEQFLKALLDTNHITEYFNQGNSGSEELAALQFLLDVGKEAGKLTEEEATETTNWAQLHIEQYNDEVNALYAEIEALKTAGTDSFEIFEQYQQVAETNPVIEYLDTLIVEFGLDYSGISKASIQLESGSRFYGNDSFGDWDGSGFEFIDSYGYLRATPMYLTETCGE